MLRGCPSADGHERLCGDITPHAGDCACPTSFAEHRAAKGNPQPSTLGSVRIEAAALSEGESSLSDVGDLGVYPKMWDMLSPKRENCLSIFGMGPMGPIDTAKKLRYSGHSGFDIQIR